MKRALLVVTAVLLAAGAGGHGRRLEAQEAAPPTPDPLEQFVPREKLEADTVVSFPVDI
jgi:hypothetical protein